MSPPDDPGGAPRRVKAAGVRRAHRRRHSDPLPRGRDSALGRWTRGATGAPAPPPRNFGTADRWPATRGPPSQTMDGKTLLATPRLNWAGWRLRRRVIRRSQRWRRATTSLWAAEEESEPRAGTRLGVRGGGEENDRRPMIRPWGRARRCWEHAAGTLPHEDPRTAGPLLLSLSRRGLVSTRAACPRHLLSSFDARSAAAPALSTPRRRSTTLPSQRPDWVSARNQPRALHPIGTSDGDPHDRRARGFLR